MYYRTEAVSGRSRGEATERWVAIVDDHRSVRSCLTRVMRLEGIRAAEFASAEEYLDHSAPTAPCCVVLDVQLPGMSGYELAELLERERPPLPPIIFISAHEDLLASIDGEAVRTEGSESRSKWMPCWSSSSRCSEHTPPDANVASAPASTILR